MARLELAPPLRRTRRYERGRRGQPDRPAPDAARRPAQRRRADPPRAPPAPGRSAAGSCCCATSRARWSPTRAPTCSCSSRGRRQRALRRGVRVRHAADAPDARAARPPPGARDPARRRDGARLVERHPHRRRAEGVQRPPRAPRHGARRGRRDRLRRLGARRPGARRARDGAARAPRPPDRVGQPARRRRGVRGARRRHGRGAAALRRAGQRPQLRRARRGRRRDRGRRDVAAAPSSAGEEPEPWASATPVAGQLGRDAERVRPEPRARRRRGGRSVAEKTCIYPGCERPAVPPHPLGGPQPAFCDLEEHNALTAHQERGAPRNERRRSPVADEVYRAVFLRVHPTGKMVLSLTTEADGNEPGYAELVGEELGIPALDVKVVPADTDRFGVGHGFNTSPSEGTPAAISSAAAKIRDKGRLLAAMALDAPPELAGVGRTARGRRGDRAQDDRGRRALRARHRRAAARRRGRPRRADGLPRLRGGPRARSRPRRGPSASRTARSRASCPSRTA